MSNRQTYLPAATNSSPYEAVAGSQASRQDRLLVQSDLSNPGRILSSSPTESSSNPSRITNQSPHNTPRTCGQPAPGTHCGKSMKNVKRCKVSPGHFANLQSVPGKLCLASRAMQSLPGALCIFARCPGDTLQFCKVSRGHFAVFLCFLELFRRMCWQNLGG